MMSKEEFDNYVEEYLARKEEEEEEHEGEHVSPLRTPIQLVSFLLLCGIMLGLSFAFMRAVLLIFFF